MVVKVEFLNPFITAAADVLRAEAGTEVKRGALSLQRSAVTTQDVTVLIGIVGDAEGIVMYSMSEPMALAIVSQMIGEQLAEFDELAQSGIAELGNVISGQAATRLSQTGVNVQISVPTLILGRGATISTLDFQRLVVPLETAMGTMEIHLALRPK